MRYEAPGPAPPPSNASTALTSTAALTERRYQTQYRGGGGGGGATDLLLSHSWGRAAHWNKCTRWAWNRSHRHRNSCRLLERRRAFLSVSMFWQWTLAQEGGEELTDDALVPPWESLPARTAVGVEAGATHVGSERGETEQADWLKSPRPPQLLHNPPNKATFWDSFMLSAFRVNTLDPVMDGAERSETRAARQPEGSHFVFPESWNPNTDGWEP